MDAIKLTILGNEIEKDATRWVTACESSKEKIEFLVINMTRNDWLERIQDFKPDLLITKPGGLTSAFKQLYDERLMILSKELGYKCYPTLDEVLIYENKRYVSYWLRAHKIPHPSTDVLYSQTEAKEYLETAKFPLVGKVNIGASGSGVIILKSKEQAVDYVDQTFSGRGAEKRSGPDLKKGGLIKRGFHYVLHPKDIADKMSKYKARAGDVQKDFVIFQEYIPHDYEWRTVRIGDSFFAHKKMKIKEKASGALIKGYENPPTELFDFVKELTDKFGFYSQAVDLFVTTDGKYLVNEMQCLFGQSDPYQMLVDGEMGRYVWKDNSWLFEAGDFNQNQSFNLRLDYIVGAYKSGKLK